MWSVLAEKKGSLVGLNLISDQGISEKRNIAFIWNACYSLTCKFKLLVHKMPSFWTKCNENKFDILAFMCFEVYLSDTVSLSERLIAQMCCVSL